MWRDGVASLSICWLGWGCYLVVATLEPEREREREGGREGGRKRERERVCVCACARACVWMCLCVRLYRTKKEC